MELTHITCCGETAPLSVDSPLRFRYRADRAVSACRIVIRKAADGCVVYDTGSCPQPGAPGVTVAFAGEPRTAYTAELTVYAADGETAAGQCRFETGLSDADTADGWIGAPGTAAPRFTRAVTVTGMCRRGRLYVAALGYADVTMDGAALDGAYFVPAWSDYHRRELGGLLYPVSDVFSYSAYYLTYDVTDRLCPGTHRLDIVLGNGFYHQNRRLVEGSMDYGEPRLYVLLEWEDAEGMHRVKGDEEFSVTAGGWLENNVYYGEVYDARAAGQGGARPASPVSPPDTVLRPQLCPRDRAFAPIVPAVVKTEGERQILDMEVNISGVVRIVTDAPAGTAITIRYAEELEENGEPDFASTGGDTQIQSDTYIADGTPQQCYAARFCWHGFRYAEITGPIERAEGIPIHADVPRRGSFSCGEETLTWLTEAYCRTQLNNLHGGVPSDCPHRERLGYTGDGQLTADTAMLLWDMESFYRKWYRDILDGQCRLTGHVQHTAPFYGGGGGPGVWGGAVVFLPYTLYRHTGDRALAQAALEPAERYIAFCRERCENGILIRELEGGWCLGDWCFSADTPGPSETFVNTYCLIRMLEQGAFLADEAGEPERADRWRSLADTHRAAFHRTFYHPETGTYDRGVAGAGAFALALGFTDALPGVAEYYTHRGRLDTGIAATPVLLDQLSRFGYIDLAVSLLTAQGCPSFAYMRENGATTLWEQWDGVFSHDHPMFGSAVGFCMHALLGLDPENAEPGWHRLCLRPQVPKVLPWACGTVTTPFGRLSVDWKQETDGIRLTVDCPPAIDAELEWNGERRALCTGKNDFLLPRRAETKAGAFGNTKEKEKR